MLSIFNQKNKKRNVKELSAFLNGSVIPITAVKDEVFSTKVLGDGIAIEPEGEIVTAPSDGVISVVMEDSKHAVGMTLNNGAEILIHVGLDTVEMNGEGFELFVKPGDKVAVGDKLLKFDGKRIQERGLEKTTVLVITNADQFADVQYLTGMDAVQGETVLVKFDI